MPENKDTEMYTDLMDFTWRIMQREGGSVCLYGTHPKSHNHHILWDSLDKAPPSKDAQEVIDQMTAGRNALDALLAAIERAKQAPKPAVVCPLCRSDLMLRENVLNLFSVDVHGGFDVVSSEEGDISHTRQWTLTCRADECSFQIPMTDTLVRNIDRVAPEMLDPYTPPRENTDVAITQHGDRIPILKVIGRSPSMLVVGGYAWDLYMSPAITWTVSRAKKEFDREGKRAFAVLDINHDKSKEWNRPE